MFNIDISVGTEPSTETDNTEFLHFSVDKSTAISYSDVITENTIIAKTNTNSQNISEFKNFSTTAASTKVSET